MVLSERLKALREEKGLSQEDLSRLSGVSQSTISDLERGIGKTTRRLPEIARALGVAVGQLDPRLMEQKDAAADFTPPVPLVSVQAGILIPRYSSALAGAEGRFLLDVVRDTLSAPPGLTAETAYAVHIVGDSMEPVFRAGDTAYVHRYHPVRRGDDVVVQLYEDSSHAQVVGLVKRLVLYNDDELIVEQFNPPKELRFDRERVKDVDKIIWAQKT